MNYAVLILPEAEDSIFRAAEWWAKTHSPQQAQRWFEGIYAAIETLEQQPQRCPLAREHGFFPIELRELHYGIGIRITHRAIFTIREDRVLVLSIRHVAQEDLQLDDLGFPLS